MNKITSEKYYYKGKAFGLFVDGWEIDVAASNKCKGDVSWR
jgi:hypothetical protein